MRKLPRKLAVAPLLLLLTASSALAYGSIGSQIGNSIIHGLIYAVIFKAMRHLSLPQAIVVAIAGIAVVAWFHRRTGPRK